MTAVASSSLEIPTRSPDCSNCDKTGFAKMPGCDNTGTELRSFRGMKNFDDCLGYCGSLPDCISASWDDTIKMCHFKSQARPITCNDSPHMETAIRCEHLDCNKGVRVYKKWKGDTSIASVRLQGGSDADPHRIANMFDPWKATMWHSTQAGSGVMITFK